MPFWAIWTFKQKRALPQIAAMPSEKWCLAFLRLEGGAERLPGVGCAVRSYCDLIGSTIGVAIMVVAIFHVALDPLDMLTTAVGFVFSVLFHFFWSPLVRFVKALTFTLIILPKSLENILWKEVSLCLCLWLQICIFPPTEANPWKNSVPDGRIIWKS